MDDRAGRLLERLPAAELDAMLVTHLTNVRYLSGFTGTNGLVLVGPTTQTFLTDFRYVEQAADEVDVAFARVQASQDLLEAVPQLLPEGPLRLGFESHSMSVATHSRLVELLGERAQAVPVNGIVERLREVKDGDELDRIRAAAALADEAYRRLLSEGLVGRTEREVAMALENHMRKLGAQRPSFDTIVAAGPHGALPHAQPRDEVIEPGQLVVIDWGAELDGYCSDCTRTVATGEVSQRAQAVYALVLAAQLAGLEGVRPGRGGREVDSEARRVIAEEGLGERFGHGLGHGVGLEVHEAPQLSQKSSNSLCVDQVVTVEPGIYLPGELGVRIEDLVIVAEQGPEILTSVPKELLVVG